MFVSWAGVDGGAVSSFERELGRWNVGQVPAPPPPLATSHHHQTHKTLHTLHDQHTTHVQHFVSVSSHITLTLQELSSPNPNSVNLKPPSQPDLMIMTHKLMEGSTD